MKPLLPAVIGVVLVLGAITLYSSAFVVNEWDQDHAFLTVLTEYQKAKEITRRRLYLETMSKILPRCGRITLIDESNKGILPLLQLNGEKGDKR